MKLPSFQFYPGDWMKDANLRRCTHAEKGVWVDMLCLMFECDQRGVLATAGQAWSDEEIARAVGGDYALTLDCVRSVVAKGVAGRTSSGAVYSRRLLRDEENRKANSERQGRFRSKVKVSNGLSNAPNNAVVTPMSEDEDEDEDEDETEGEVRKIRKGVQGETGYHPDSRTALHLLNEACGIHYREVDSNLKIISARLNEPGVDIDGVRKMIQRQCQQWKGTDYGKYLRPETLFRQSKFDGYYAARDQPIIGPRQAGPDRNAGVVGGADIGRADRILARRKAESEAAARQAVASKVAGPGTDMR